MKPGKTFTASKQREPNPDLIRIIACLMVITVHFYHPAGYGLDESLLCVLSADGVTLFFLLAGFFMFRKPFRKALASSILHIVLPAYITMFLLMLFNPAVHGDCTFPECFHLHRVSVSDYISNILYSGGNLDSTGHLWYIRNYMFLILAIPAVKPLCQQDRYSRHRIFIVTAACLLALYQDITYIIPDAPQVLLCTAFPG